MRTNNFRMSVAYLLIIGLVTTVLAYSERTRKRLKTVNPILAEKFGKVEKEMEQKFPQYETEVTSANRTCKEQDALYAKGRTKPGRIVTWVKCGQSFHNYGRAIDIAPFANGKFVWNDDKYWLTLRKVVRKNGLVSGGYWKKKDWGHAQMGNSLKGAKADLKINEEKTKRRQKPTEKPTVTRQQTDKAVKQVKRFFQWGMKQFGFG
ncbi:MAG TPA: M15 family metallopeptidase [Pyrinomonadaceae bacterium]|nr:M15 family metallopeptidase [Pyrinomonadaceae bacterium]